MGTLINKTTLQVKLSANEALHPKSEWWHNPVQPKCDQKYWKNDNDVLKEMTQAEKDSLDQAESDVIAQAEDNAKDIDNLDKLIRSFAMTVLDEINILRVKAGESERTIAQLKSAVKTKYDTL